MKYLGYALLAVLLVCSVLAERKITLDTPVQAMSGADEFDLNSFSFDISGKQLVIGFREVGGDRSLTFTYSGADFEAAFGFFVDAALEDKIITRLQTDGKLGAGSISGTP